MPPFHDPTSHIVAFSARRVLTHDGSPTRLVERRQLMPERQSGDIHHHNRRIVGLLRPNRPLCEGLHHSVRHLFCPNPHSSDRCSKVSFRLVGVRFDLLAGDTMNMVTYREGAGRLLSSPSRMRSCMAFANCFWCSVSSASISWCVSSLIAWICGPRSWRESFGFLSNSA